LKLGEKYTESIPLVKTIRQSAQDTKNYEIDIINDKLMFDIPEINHDYDDKKDVFAYITVKYKTISKLINFIENLNLILIFIQSIQIDFSEFYLGYCKLSLYRPQLVGTILTWNVIEGDVVRYLHPGTLTYDIENISDRPDNSYNGN
jgi:hypothetical protein